MAKLSFIKGAVTGKLGEFVGAKWKGINYIRLFAKPANPKTEKQVEVRSVFKALSLFASALFSLGLFIFFPIAKRMTERNQVFKANKPMLTSRLFNASRLQVCSPIFTFLSAAISCIFNSGEIQTNLNVTLPYSLTEGKIHYFVYDFVKGLIVCNGIADITNLNYTNNFTSNVPDGFNTTEGSLIANCKVYIFATGLSSAGKKVISDTLVSAVSV